MAPVDNPMPDPGLTLAPQCALRDADDLKTALKPLLDLPQEVTIDASAVQRIDTATLQLLVAFVVTRRAASRGVRWRAPSEALISSAWRLGLQEPLRLKDPG